MSDTWSWPAAARIWVAAWAPRWGSRPVTITEAPMAARPHAVCRPMPSVPPVMSAVFPARVRAAATLGAVLVMCSSWRWLFAVASDGGEDSKPKEGGGGESGVTDGLADVGSVEGDRPGGQGEQQRRDEPDGCADEGEDEPVGEALDVFCVPVVGEKPDSEGELAALGEITEIGRAQV